MIYLIGMMGSGKSTVGQQLALELNMRFVDTDQVIENKTGKSISELIESEGIDQFRQIESEVLHSLEDSNQIIATGGGIILDKVNRMIMKERGTIIYLKVSIEELKNRLLKTDVSKRPLLTGDIEETLNKIYQKRKLLYESIADYIICSDLLDDVIYQIKQVIIK